MTEEFASSLCKNKFASNLFDSSDIYELALFSIELKNRWEKTFDFPYPEIDEKTVFLRYGVCAFKTEKIEESGAAFATVLKKEPNNYEANFYIGKVLYVKKFKLCIFSRMSIGCI